MDNFLLLNLKTMFEHHVEDNVWKNQQGLVKVLNWKLYDSYGVHCVTMQNMLFYLLVEKIYPLTNYTLHQMFNDVKLQVDCECEMAFELFRLVKKQLKEGYGRIVRFKSLLEVTAAKVCVTTAKQKRLPPPRKEDMSYKSLQLAVMSSVSSVVTYTSVYTDSEPWRFYGGSDEEPADTGSPGVIIYRYDGLPMHPVAPPSSDYVPGPEHPPSPDYVPGLEHPPSLVYTPKPEYPEYLVPSRDEAPIGDQPLPTDASPIALSLGYVANSDPEEDPEEDHADYPADGGDGDDEPSDDENDDDVVDDEDEEASEDEDDDEEEEHLASADSSAVLVIDPVPSTRDTEAFETDESTPTPRSPQIVARLLALPTPPPSSLTPLTSSLPQIPSPPLPVSSPPLPLPSPAIDSPTYVEAPLGYREARIRMRAASPPLLLPSTSHRIDILEAEMPPQKRACFTTPASEFEVGESSAAGAARQPGPALEADLRRERVREMGYGITDTWDEIVKAMLEIASTTLEGDAQDDQAFLRARVNILFRDRRFHRHTAMFLDREAMYAHRAWTGSEDRSAAIEAHVRILEA
ncbi:hypothetical protein Tco_1502576 [Tanacetum coccineum]